MSSSASSFWPTVAEARQLGQQVGLVGVAGHHHGRVPAQPGQQHLQLAVGAVLRLVDHHEGVVQGAAAHEADRGDLDGAFVASGRTRFADRRSFSASYRGRR